MVAPTLSPQEVRELTDALSAVSTTALLTLWARAIDSRSPDPVLHDPAAERLVDRLRPLLAATDTPLHRRLVQDRLPRLLVPLLALRGSHYDAVAQEFHTRFPHAVVVNLGCGLDTRFERLDDGNIHVLDLDLPPMIALKRQLVAAHPRHPLLAASVLDPTWMDALDRYDDGRFLFLAEGLFMYLEPADVKQLVLTLAARFPGSELVAEVFNDFWLRRPWRSFTQVKMQRQLNFDSDAMFRSGMAHPAEWEGWSPALRLLDVWSYFDAPAAKLGPLRWMRHIPLLRLTQYSVHYRLG